MEEEVSNFIQDRHRFVVDILLSVALLEEEHEILTRQIEAFEFSQRERRNAMIATKSGKGTYSQQTVRTLCTIWVVRTKYV